VLELAKEQERKKRKKRDEKIVEHLRKNKK